MLGCLREVERGEEGERKGTVPRRRWSQWEAWGWWRERRRALVEGRGIAKEADFEADVEVEGS